MLGGPHSPQFPGVNLIFRSLSALASRKPNDIHLFTLVDFSF